jgi:hypothetical protein
MGAHVLRGYRVVVVVAGMEGIIRVKLFNVGGYGECQVHKSILGQQKKKGCGGSLISDSEEGPLTSNWKKSKTQRERERERDTTGRKGVVWQTEEEKIW